MSRSLGGMGAWAALAMGAAMAAVQVAPLDHYGDRPRRASRPRSDRPGFIPNDHGPVIDTTPESKRAKRRRLAKSAA